MVRVRLALAALIVFLAAPAAAWGAEVKSTPAPLPAKAAAEAPAKPASTPTAAAAMTVEKAVAAMRHVQAADLTEDQKTAKALELSLAWKTLVEAGKPGAEALKAEIRKVDAAAEKDDFFRLGAAAVLWMTGRIDEAETIAAQWRKAENLDVNYNYVFGAAFEAAQTQDPRAGAMLLAILRHKGHFFVPEHVMGLDWTLVNEFLWGEYGPKGLPLLEKVLETSKDRVEIEAAVRLLSTAQYLPALPTIRRLAAEGTGDVRTQAIWNLGVFGHPQDYEFLVKGLGSKDPKEAFNFAFALYEFEDLRAVPLVVPLLDSADDHLRNEAEACVEHLLTPEGLAAMQKRTAPPAGATPAQRESAAENADFVAKALKAMNLTWEAYAAKTPKEQEALVAAVRARTEEWTALKKDDRRLTHEDLLKAAEEWKKNHRITGGTFDWVEDRHALAASTAADIDLWLEVRAKVLMRLSDECLGEVRTLEDIIRRLGRSRYRTEPGLTAKAELPPAAP